MPIDLVTRTVRQVDEGVTPARGVQIRPADADDRAADAHLAGVGVGFGHGLEDDVVERVDDDSTVGARGRRVLADVHHAVYPPSATSTEPVMKEAASLARKTTLGAISSGIAYRCCGASSIQ